MKNHRVWLLDRSPGRVVSGVSVSPVRRSAVDSSSVYPCKPQFDDVLITRPEVWIQVGHRRQRPLLLQSC